VSAAHSFFLAMTLFPEAQAAAQAELDAVVGPARLPTLADRAQLPYLGALLTELLRWAPVAPQALPHAANADGTFRGHFIPKGAIVIANVWCALPRHVWYLLLTHYAQGLHARRDALP
jgi:cytochrome P450